MLQNIGTLGLVLLVCSIALIFLLVRNYNKYSLVGEASRTKYIVVWVLVGFFANIFSTIWSVVWVNSFLETILNPPSNFTMFLSYYAIFLAGIYYIFTFTHSFFTSLVRKKIIPYIWWGSILGILFSIGQLSTVEISSLHPESLTYNSFALILSQLIYIGLISRWIRRNPGLELAVVEQGADNNNQKEPKINSANVKTNEIDSDNDLIPTESYQLKSVLDDSNAVGRSEKPKPVKEINPSGQTSSENPWCKPTDEITTFSDEPDLDISLDESSVIRRQELCEFLYAASKFGNVEEVLELLSQLGFSVSRDQVQFKIEDKNGLERVLDGEDNLISFAKRLSVK